MDAMVMADLSLKRNSEILYHGIYGLSTVRNLSRDFLQLFSIKRQKTEVDTKASDGL